MHILGALFPVTAGILFYGWRTAGLIVMVVGSAGLTAMVWRRIGLRRRLRIDHTLWLALLLALMLPVHLASTFDSVAGTKHSLWPLLPAAGIVLVFFIWMLGGGRRTNSSRADRVSAAVRIVPGLPDAAFYPAPRACIRRRRA